MITAVDAASFTPERVLYMRRMAARYVSPDEVDDAVQDALLLAWRRRNQFRGDSAFTTWLITIVRNACLSRLRRPEPLQQLNDWDQPLEETVTTRIYRREQREIVRRSLSRLGGAARRVVESLLDGREIDMRINSNKAARHRALVGLQSAVSRRMA